MQNNQFIKIKKDFMYISLVFAFELKQIILSKVSDGYCKTTYIPIFKLVDKTQWS